MSSLSAYWRLTRCNKPIGILLLWCPTAIALWLANKGMPSLKLVLLFLIGTILMRAAGCVVNDIADRNIDKHVARTKCRPLTSGEVSLPAAFVLLIGLLACALIILLNLPKNCFIWALFSLLITIAYPFCKRFIKTPQLVLGLAFSMGIPMTYVASGVAFDSQFYLLLVVNFLWIIAYDTMYAMADREDDLRIGVKSTAVYFADYDRLIIGFLLVLMQGIWLFWAFQSNVGLWFYSLWTAALGVLIYQQFLIKDRDPAQCFKAFGISAYYGLCMWLAVILGIS